jgi:hypothetical protein
LQIFGEKLIALPKPGHPVQATGTLFVGIREATGSVTLILVCVWLILVRDEITGRKRRLFPWINVVGRYSFWLGICQNIPGWLRGKIS